MQGKFIAYIADFGAYYLMQKLLHIKSVCRKAFVPLAAFIAASGFLSARIKSIVKQHHWPIVMLSPDEVSLSEVSAKAPELYI